MKDYLMLFYRSNGAGQDQLSISLITIRFLTQIPTAYPTAQRTGRQALLLMFIVCLEKGFN
jgi:hypothetical protein